MPAQAAPYRGVDRESLLYKAMERAMRELNANHVSLRHDPALAQKVMDLADLYARAGGLPDEPATITPPANIDHAKPLMPPSPAPGPEADKSPLAALDDALYRQTPSAAGAPSMSLPPAIAAPSQPKNSQPPLDPTVKAYMDAEMQKVPPGFLDNVQDLGRKAAEGIVTPTQWPEAVGNVLKGAASAFTFGGSESVLPIDKDSWATTVGKPLGFAAQFVPVGRALGLGGRMLGLTSLANPILQESIAGAGLSAADAVIRPRFTGEEGPNPIAAAVTGAVIPPAMRAAVKGAGALLRPVGRMLGIGGAKAVEEGTEGLTKELTAPVPGTAEFATRRGVPTTPGVPPVVSVNRRDIPAYQRLWGDAGDPASDVVPLGGGKPLIIQPTIEEVADPNRWRGEAVTLVKGTLMKANLPERIFRSDPAARNVYNALGNTADRMAEIGYDIASSFKQAIEPLSKQGRNTLKIGRLQHQNRGGIDEWFLANGGAEGPAIVQANALINQRTAPYREMLVAQGQLRPEQVIENYVPFMRYKVAQKGRILVEESGDMNEIANYYTMPARVRASFMKTRHNQDIPQQMMDMPLETILDRQAKAMARAIALEEQFIRGGLGEAGKVQIAPGKTLTWLEQEANKVGVDANGRIVNPALRDRMETYIADALGARRGISEPIVQDLAAQVRKMEFYHLLAFNALSPIVNSTQGLLAASHMGVSAYAKAVKNIFTNAEMIVPGIAKPIKARDFSHWHLGASGQYNQIDQQLLEHSLLGKIARVGSWPFRMSEQWNQQTTALGGYYEGLARGLAPKQAMQFGKELNRYINQFGSLQNTPEMFRTPIMGVVGQFKPYQIGYWGIMKDMATNAIRGMGEVAKGHPVDGWRQAAPLVKYLSMLGVMGGTATVIGDAAFGDQNTVMGKVRRWLPSILEPYMGEFARTGVLGALGANLANQVGIGAMPFAKTDTNMKDLLWFIPGPFLSHVMDGFSLASYAMDRIGLNSRATPQADSRAGINFTMQNPGAAIGPDEVASMFIRAFPLGGPQLDRFRKWAKSSQAGGNEIEALDFLQALGIEVPTGTFVREKTEAPWIDQKLGLPESVSQAKNALMFNPAKRQDLIHLMQQEKAFEQAYNDALRGYNQYLAANRPDDAKAILQQFEDRYGVYPQPSVAGFQAALKRRLYPSLRRQEEGMPKPLQWPTEVIKRMREID